MSKDQHQKQRNKSRSKAAGAASEDMADDTKTGKDVKKEKQDPGESFCYHTKQSRVRSDDDKLKKQCTDSQQAAEEQPKARKKDQQATEEQTKTRKKYQHQQATEEQTKTRKKYQHQQAIEEQPKARKKDQHQQATEEQTKARKRDQHQQATEKQPKARKKDQHQHATEEQPKARKKDQQATEEHPKARKKVSTQNSSNNKASDGVRRSKWKGIQKEQSTLGKNFTLSNDRDNDVHFGEEKKGPSRSCLVKKGESKKIPHERVENITTTAALKNLTKQEFRASQYKKQGKNLKPRTNTLLGIGGERKEAVKRKAIAKEDDFNLPKDFLSFLNGMTITETFSQLNKRLAGLERLLNNENGLEVEEFLKCMLHVLATCCQVSSSENLNPLLKVLKNSLFFSKHITDCLKLIQSNGSKITETEQIRAIDEMISIFSVYLRHFPSSYCDIPLDMVQKTLEVTQFQEKSELIEKLARLQCERDEIIKAERKRLTRPFQSCFKGQQKPPDNYREIQICPTIKELNSNQKPFLRKNIKRGCYEDAEHYLDVQFRLYREDFIAPLREGIQEVVNKVPRKERNLNIKLYHSVRIVSKEFTKSGIVHKVSFDSTRLRFTNWNCSKRLIFGSFLCLSRDNFRTIMFATVANRDPEELKKGRFDIHFVEGEEVIGIEKRDECYIIAESPAYFEAYRHVLVGLQGMTEENLPFKEYLVQCSPEVNSPLYLREFEEREPVKYNLSRVFDNLSLPPLNVLSRNEWPKTETLPLNESQLEAFYAAISKEFTVIQGPPGTGKTYVGLKIVQALLENRHVWDPRQQSPMLMVCFTNHALDQFLEGVAEFHSNGIVRVGGRCKSERLHRYNIRNFVEYDMRRNNIYMQMRAWEAYIEQAKQFSEYPNNCDVTFDHLEEVIEDRFLRQLFFHPNLNLLEARTPSGLLEAWLMNKFPASETQRADKNAKLAQPRSKQIPEMDQCDSSMEGAHKAKPEEEAGRQELKATLEEQTFVLSQTCVLNTNRGAIQNSKTLQDEIENKLEGSKTETEILRHQDKAQDVHKKPQKSESGNISKSNAFEEEEEEEEEDSPNNQVFQVSKIHVKETYPSADDRNRNIREMKNDNQREENDKRSLDSEDHDYVCLDNDENSSGENNETIAIDQEADIIQSHRYQAGEEDMFSPIRNISLAAVNHNRNVFNAEEDKQKEKQKRKKKPSNVKICKEDRDRVNKLLLQETGLKQNETVDIRDMWLLPERERIRLYLHWVDCFRERWKWKLEQAEETYKNQCIYLANIKTEEDERVLRRATVIGMTTSCAARYHSVLQQVRPKIVVIEEAAEVLEAHILTSLTQDTHHVILIGDHKQLRPKPTVYKLAQEFNLAISLFERMVLNNMDCKQLCIQHRMRPEIASLTKRIYDHEIEDSEKVQEYPHICGVQKNLFFLGHTEPENFHEGLQSYSNNHEANFVAALCKYLLQQGYQKSQITILTMYTGQMLKIKEKMPLASFKGVRLSAVDNFQGEENDIVILSLVRSNKQESIGFLKEPNRICVSLSRARMGLYVVGNFNLMCSQSSLWKDICEHLINGDKLGSTLPLICEKHKNVTHVKTADDFRNIPEGGCNSFCEDRLKCGHVCVRRCHPSDPEHKKYRCQKQCLERCSEGHPCTKICHFPRECGQCQVNVVKRFPDCGHEINTACGKDLCMMSCNKRCERVLECNHQCNRRCSDVCVPQFCKFKVKKTLPCNHIKEMPCSKDPVTVQCNVSCAKLLDCQHSCPGKCYENCKEQICKKEVEKLLSCGHIVSVRCFELEKRIECHHPCNRKLLCKHDCPAKCYETCPHNYCKAKVVKTLPCNHQKTMECYRRPTDVVCQSQCERELSCGHLCTEPCGNTCRRATCSEVVEAILPCGHLQQVRCGDHPNFICKAVCGNTLCTKNHICKKQCHNGRESCGKCTALLTVKLSKCNHEVQVQCWESLSQLTCPHPCSRSLSCGHSCKLKCGMNCEDSVCKKKITKTLPCDHKKVLPCFVSKNDYQCSEKVKRKLPCGHEQQCLCHEKLEDVKCNVMVQTILDGCGHTKLIPCFQTSGVIEGKIVAFCDTVIPKLLPCGHEVKLPCSQDIKTVFCEAQCDQTLSCGHRCKEKCGADCKKAVCQMECTRKLKCGHHCSSLCGKKCPGCKEKCERLLPCNHPCRGLCSEPCDPSTCTIRVKKPFPCGHVVKKGLPCRIFKNATCKLNCQRKLPCGHNCSGKCGIPCAQYKCHIKTVKPLPCGHSVAVECYQLSEITKCVAPCVEKLVCGHTCSGVCGKCQEVGAHETCKLPCGRTLVCSHRCRAPCSQPCPPCTRPCQRSCVHKRCENKCGEECEPCKLPCACSCPHFQCNNLCNEICNRPLCNEPCQKKLRCGHACIGLCGELCPSLCRVCNSKQLAAIEPRSPPSSNKRFVQLFNCGHLFEVSFLDNWMLAESESTDHEQIHLKCCPDCSVPVFFSFRYSKEAKMTTRSLNAVSLELEEMGEALSTEMFANLQRLYKYRQKFRSPLKIDQKFCVTNISVLLKLINETMDKTEDIRREQRKSAALQIRCAKTVPQVSTEIKSRLQQLVKVCEMMEGVLMNQQTDIGVMIKLSQIAIIVSLVMDIVEVKVNIVNNSKTLTSIADGTLNNIFDATEIPGEVMAADKPRTGPQLFISCSCMFYQLNSLAQLFSILAQWKSVAHLEDEVDELRSEAGLTPKQHITIKLVSFPGLCRDTWFTCGRGHVFARCQTTLVSAYQEPVTTTVTECLTCKQSDSLSETSTEELGSSSDYDV